MFFSYLWKKKWNMLGYILLAVAASVSMATFNIYIAPVFDDAQAGNYDSVIWRLGFMFLWYIATRLLDYYTELTGIHVVNTVRQNIKQDLFSAVMNKQLPAFADRDTGEYIAEFTNDITVIENKFLIPCKEMVSYLITIVTACAAIFTIDVRMTLVLAVGVVFCLSIPLIMTRYTTSRMSRFLRRFDHFVQFLKDSFSAFFTFKNYAVEDKIVDNFTEENTQVEKDKYRAEFSLVVMNNLVGRFAWTIEILIVVIGLVGVINGSLTIGSVFSAYLLAGSLGMPLQSLGNRISMIRSVGAIEQKFKALSELDEVVTPAEDFSTEGIKIDIKLDQVSLSIKGNPILHNINITFEHGKKYLVLGSNGSGKSTMAKLLKNTYSGYEGSILLDTYDLATPEGAALSRLVSYSNETVSLLSDTVRNNILLYRDVSDDRLETAVRLAGLRVPMNRKAGDGGRFLSSGERRKLELARALIDDPQVMILDEVVSTLDIETAYETEKLVLSLEDRTVIMISNAFSGQLLDQYDQIVLMNQGSILAQGTHSELIQNSDEYR